MVLKLLFICSRNLWRSPTAEKLFHGHRGCVARSAGTSEVARVRVNAAHLKWADKIFVMEREHESRLRGKFSEELDGRQIVCLHIEDDYAYGDAELVALLKAAVEPHLENSST